MKAPAPLLALRRAVGRWFAPVTPVGRAVLVLGAVSWVAGAALGWRELLVLAAACLLAVAASVAFTFGRATLEVTVRLEPQRVKVGERAVGELLVVNAARHRLLPLEIELPVGRALARFEVPSLGAGASYDEVFQVPTQRRAVIPVGPASSVRGDPLGLLRKEVPWNEPVELFVHPRTVGLERLGAGFLRDLEGQQTNEISTSDVAFHALREYVPGDDRRHIHWKTTARTGKLMVRQFLDTRRSHLGMVVSGDPVDYAGEEEFELAVSAAASLAVRALLDEQAVSAVASTTTVTGVTGRQVLDGFSRAVFGADGADLRAGVAQLNRTAKGISIVALVCGSACSIADVKAAAARLPADLRVLVLRAHVGGQASLRAVGTTMVLTIAELEELPRVLWTASQR